MPIARSRSGEHVVQYAGRRLTLTETWADVTDDVLEHLIEVLGDLVELQGAVPVTPTKVELKHEGRVAPESAARAGRNRK